MPRKPKPTCVPQIMNQPKPPIPNALLGEGAACAISVLARRNREASALSLLNEGMRHTPGRTLAETGIQIALQQGDFALCRLCLDWLQAHSTPAEIRQLSRWEDDFALWQRAAKAMQPSAAPLPPLASNRLYYALHNALPFSTGGYATRGHGLAQGLVAAGWDVHCVTRPGYPMDITGQSAADVDESDLVDTIRYHRILAPERSGLPVWDYILAAADKHTEMLRALRPARVLAASDFTTALPALFAARRCGIPFIYEVRGLWEITEISHNPALEASEHFQYRTRMETLAATSADHILTLTGPLQHELIRRGVPAERITLAPNSCDTERFRPRSRDAELAAHYNLPPDVPVIGYVGSFVQYEGLDHLVQACAILRAQGVDFRLLLVGDEGASGQGAGPLTQEIKNLIHDGRLDDKAILPGRIPNDMVEAHYSLIDIAPFPRKPQPVTEMVSPIKPIEAMAMERAVVVSSVAALAELVEDNQTGVVFRKGDLLDLVRVLEQLLTDPILRNRLGQAARRWVIENRRWADTAIGVSEVLNRPGTL